MKKNYFLFFLIVLVFQSCLYPPEEDLTGYEHSAYEPVYWARADLDASIQLMPPKSITNSGKIYLIDDLLFVGEKRQGFHIFDNSDLQNPVELKFIQILGSSDIAVRNNVLYINQATDLVTLQYDFENDQLNLVKRIKHTFPELSSPDGYIVYDIPEDSVIIDWKLKN